MEINFSGKRALVTGAGKGIGRAIATKLAECGAEVVAISRTQSDLDELSKTNDKITTLCLDIGEWENTKSALQDIGPIDLLVNNAGIGGAQEFDTITEEDIDKIYNVNVKAIINISQTVAKGMKERGVEGSIVNISSIVGFQAMPLISVYGSSKAALDQLTRCMAVEFGPYKIRVNSVNPTGIRTRMSEEWFKKNTEMTAENSPPRDIRTRKAPLRDIGEVDEVAYPVLFLLSDKASLITGVILPIDGGLTVTL